MRIPTRLYVHEMLDGERRHGFWLIATDVFLFTVILLNVAAVVLETLPGWQRRFGLWFTTLELITVVVFTVEYALRIWSCVEDRRRDYRHPVWGRLRYALTPLAIIDLLAVLPFYLAFIVPLDLRILRIFRLIRVLKLTRYSAALRSLVMVVRAEVRPLLGAAMLMAMGVLLASSVMYVIERQIQPEVFDSIPKAMWWGVVTLTTVGYGDVTPASPLGKAVGALVMMFGIGIFALPTAILAAGFARELGKQDFVVTVSRVAKVPVFHGLDPVTLAEIAALLTPMSTPARFVVVRRGETGTALYFIVRGQVDVELPHGSVQLGPGEFFGEMSLLAGLDRRNATITTLTDCNLLALEAPDFRELAQRIPELADRFAEVAKNRKAPTPHDQPHGARKPADRKAESAD